MGNFKLTIASRLNNIQEEKKKYVNEGKNENEKIKRLTETQNSTYLPSSIAKKTAICYQTRCSASDFPHTILSSSKYSNVKMNIFFTVKMANTGKLSSHMWFFQGFCKLFNPDYCTILECGTVPHKEGLFNFFQVLEADKEIGAVCGHLQGKNYNIEYKKIKQLPFKFKYDKEDPISMKIFPFLMNFAFVLLNFCLNKIEKIFLLKRAQQFEYIWDNIYNKSYQSLLGYVAVLPSTWSAYRWDALNEDNLLEKEYLISVKNPDYVYKSVMEANIILTADRLISLAIISKRNHNYYLKYLPDAIAEVDLLETIPDLLTQKKRIINGSIYALEHLIYYTNQLRYSKHSKARKLMFYFVVFMSKISLAILYLFPSLCLIVSRILMFSYFDQISVIANPLSSLAGFFLFCFIAMMTTLIFISLQFKSIDKDMIFVFRFLSHFLGIFMLLTFAILLILIITEICKGPVGYFVNQTIIQILVLIIFGSILMVVIFNPYSWKHLIFGSIHYLYYLPTYAHITIIYAFCRIDDLSWGVRGAHINSPPSQKKEFKDFKVEFVSTWLFANALISYIMVVIISAEIYKDIFLTMFLGLIAFITSVKAFLSFLNSIKYWLFDQNEYINKMKEIKPNYKKEKEEIEKYYEMLRLEGAEEKQSSGLYSNNNEINRGLYDSNILLSHAISIYGFAYKTKTGLI